MTSRLFLFRNALLWEQALVETRFEARSYKQITAYPIPRNPYN